MKNLITAGLLTLGLLACKDREPAPDVLPAATQTGANTGGALVDGKVWVAKVEMPDYNPGGNNTRYQALNGKYSLQIILRKLEGELSHSFIEFYIVDEYDITTKNYSLGGKNYSGGYSPSVTVNFITDNQSAGILTITKFDKEKHIISGTFSFKAKDSNGNIVNITDGRFDKKFTN